MYLDIHTLEIADGLKDALVHSDFTIESILKRGPSEIASIMGIDPYIAGIIFNAAKKLLNLMVLCKNKIIILSNCLVPNCS